MTLIHAVEGMVRDPRTNTDKYYRCYAFGEQWTTHYGRNGEIGTVGKVVTAKDEEAARAAAAKKYEQKARTSGYRRTFEGVIDVDSAILEEGAFAISSAIEPVLAQLRTAPGEWTGEPVRAVAAAPVATTLPDATDEVAAALGASIEAVPAQPGHLWQADPLLPMLASVPDPDRLAALMADPTVVAQRKYDGDRVLIEVVDGQVTVRNRQGRAKVRNLSVSHTTPFTALGRGRWILDGEVVGQVLVLFDAVVMTDGTSTWVHEGSAFLDRFAALEALLGALGPDPVQVALAPLYDDSVEDGAKDGLLTDAVAKGHEGIILRDAFAPYQQGLRSAHLVKHKLVKDADVVITELHATKESAALAVHDDDGSLREVGAASTIGKGVVAVGDVWVATYLYVNDPANPRMVQPRLVRRRDDKGPADCSIDQFADAGTDRTV